MIIINRILFWLTPGIVKSYYEEKIDALQHHLKIARLAIDEMKTGEGFKVFARDQRELTALIKRQIAMRRVLQHSNLQTQPRFRLPFVARIFRAVSKWLARWAKSLDHSAGAGKMVEENGKPQLQLDLQKGE